MPARSFLMLLVTCVTVLLVMPGRTFAGTPDTVDPLPGIALGGAAGIASDTLGNLYIADTAHNQIVMVTSAGVITRYGSGTAGFTPFTATTVIGVPATTAVKFNAPVGIATDLNGNVYVADTGNNRIHMIAADTTTKLISAASQISTVAGSGAGGFSGDDGPAVGASLNGPTGVAVDASGKIYIADNGNYRIRMTTVGGNISTLAGDGTATKLTAYGIALSPAGDLYIADAGNNRILKMTAALGVPSVFAGNGTAGFSGDGGLASLAQLNQPSGVVTNGQYLYIADTMNSCVRRVSLATNVISTRLGAADKFSAITAPAGFSNPASVALDAAGTLYVEDTGNKVIQQVYPSVSAITTSTPPGGSYSTAQSVVLTSQKAANIYYTTDGTVPSGSSTLYTAAIPISTTTTLRFTSIDFSGNQEVINSATYTIDTIAPSTSITINATPVNDVYYSALSTLAVSLTSNEPNTSIYYTTNGTVPTTTATANLYTIPVPIPVTTTLTTTNVQFFGVDAAGLKGNIQSQKYQIIALTTAASPAGGVYSAARNVTLTANNPSAIIYYTLDGTDPTTNSAVYAGPVEIAANTTLKFRAKDANDNLEQTKSQVYTIDSMLPTLSVSPVGGTFGIPQTVTLTSDKPNVTIYYTITGISPTSSSTKYSAPLAIAKTTTLMYFGIDTVGNKSVVGAQTYIIDTVAPITTASVPSGTYSSIQSVTLTTDDPTATTYYTTNGNTPTLSSPKYTTPITITATTTLKYFSIDPIGNLEQIKTQLYTIDVIPPNVSVSLVGGTFRTPQTVTLTSNEPNTVIYYTTTGISPTSSSSKYTAPLVIAKTTTLMYFGVDAAGNKSAVGAQTYIIDTVAPITTASLSAGFYSSPQLVILTTDDASATTYYTIDGSTPTLSSTLYTSPITITATTPLKYFSIDPIGNLEQIKTQLYTIDVIPPNVSVSLVGGTFRTPQTVTLTSNEPNTVIYYTTTGLFPTTTSPKYSAPLAITKTTTLMYFGVDAAGNKSAVGVHTYILDTVAPITTASVPSGTYSSIQSVTLTTDDPTATIYFTIDGSTPTDASTKYTSPILISGPTVLQYFAKDISGNPESVKKGVYTINTLTTSASPKGGVFFTPQTVALLSNNPGATIYYTTDGTAPSTDTTVSKTTQKYSKPLLLQGYKTTLKFFSVDAMGVVEHIKTEEYVINSLTTTVSPKGGIFNSPLAVTLKSSNSGATIYYTLDGTTPSNDAKLSKTTHSYTSPLYVQNGKTILKFFSLDAQGVSENVNTEIYTVDSAPPSATAKCGVTANSIELSARDGDDLLPEILYSTSNSASATGTPFTYYTAPIIFTLNTIVRFFAVDSAGNVGQMETVSCPAVVAPLDLKPALYLETATDRSTTSNGSLYVTGNVDPSATITINGTAATTNADGSFFHKIQLAIGENTITTVATRGAQNSSDTRIVNYVMPGPQTHDPLIAIGTGNGVIGNRVRVPITLTSGFQAATVSIDLDTSTFSGVLATPTVEIAQSAAARGKFIQIAPPSEGVYNIVITDIKQPVDGVTKRAPIPEGVIAYLSLTVISPNSVSEPLTVKEYSAKDLDNNVMTANAATQGAVHGVSKPGNTWSTDANAEVPVTLKDALDALYMLLDPVTYPVSGSADLNADGRVQINELQQVINSLIGL